MWLTKAFHRLVSFLRRMWERHLPSKKEPMSNVYLNSLTYGTLADAHVSNQIGYVAEPLVSQDHDPRPPTFDGGRVRQLRIMHRFKAPNPAGTLPIVFALGRLPKLCMPIGGAIFLGGLTTAITITTLKVGVHSTDTPGDTAGGVAWSSVNPTTAGAVSLADNSSSAQALFLDASAIGAAPGILSENFNLGFFVDVGVNPTFYGTGNAVESILTARIGHTGTLAADEVIDLIGSFLYVVD